jgi:superoxide dismutase
MRKCLTYAATMMVTLCCHAIKKYQNLRASYVDAFWNIVNWPEVSTRFDKAQKSK